MLGGTIPVGTEDDVLHVLLEYGRLVPKRFADDHIHGEDGLMAGVDGAQAKLRNIHDHRRLRELVGQPAPAPSVKRELLDPEAERGIEFLYGLRAQASVRREAMTVLESLDRLHQRRLIDIAGRDASTGG